MYLWTRIPLDGLSISFVEAFSVGATLSATDPVTILAIFNTYKVDPKLYTVIFGESILNDAIAIVLFETAQRYKTGGSTEGSLSILSFFEAIGIFLLIFFGSLMIGVAVGIGTALGLKYTLVRRFPKIESCLVVLIAYASYFFSNGVHMSGMSHSRRLDAMRSWLTGMRQASYLCCFVASPSNIMHTTTCHAAPSSPPNISSRCLPNFLRTSSSFILA